MPPMKPPGRAPNLVSRRRDAAITALRHGGASVLMLAAATGLTIARIDEILARTAMPEIECHGEPVPC